MDAPAGYDTALAPLEGSQWLMPWEWSAEERAKAGVKDAAPVILPETWKEELDKLDHH